MEATSPPDSWLLPQQGVTKFNLKSIISLTTDGAPSMVGREKGVVSRLKKDNPDLITYHCIIHQSVLCASLDDEYRGVMETVIKMVNFLRSTSALKHRLF